MYCDPCFHLGSFDPIGAVLINFDDRHRTARVDKLGAHAALEIDHSSDSRHAIEDLLKPFEDRREQACFFLKPKLLIFREFDRHISINC